MADVLLLSSGRASAAEPTLVDAAASPLLLDLKGRLLVSQKPAIFPLQSAGLVNVNDALAVNVEDSAVLVFHLKNYGTVTLAAGQFQFEASVDSTTGIDGTWFAIQALRTNANTIETQAAPTGVAAGAGNVYGWRVGTAGYKWVRVRCSVAVTASAIAFWQAMESPNSVDPVPGLSAHPVTISGTPAVTQSGVWTVTQSGAWAITSTPAAGSEYLINTPGATIAAGFMKASAGNLMEMSIFNGSAATVYVKLWNKVSAPVPSTDAALLKAVIPVAAGAVWNQEFGSIGKRCTIGIGIAITAAAAATDVAVVGAGVTVSATFI